ncbi:MAG: hypothetical protein R6X32_19795 [Chloroflexota bacterium]|jgi:hypothetical protein
MDAVYIFLIRNDVWIYILSAFGLFWYASELIRAHGILRQAMFNLERETGQRKRNNALFFIILLSSIVGGVYYVNNSIAPTLPATLQRAPTPTPDPLSSPVIRSTPQPIPGGDNDIQPRPPVAPTVTLPSASSPAQPDLEPEPGEAPPPPPVDEPTPTPFVGCTMALRIDDPLDGAVIDGPITFLGTANTAAFGYYELEANGPETGGAWANLLGRRIDQPAIDGFLGNVDLRDWQSGPYLIRLATYDNIGFQTGVCVIQVTLANE